MNPHARAVALLMSVALVLAACGESDSGTSETTTTPETEVAQRPALASIVGDASWQWQLQGDINTAYDVDVYDIDLFDASQDVIDQLRADGRTVICYFSAGSFEQWRDDADAFPAAAIGNTLDGWEDERWVDTRDATVNG